MWRQGWGSGFGVCLIKPGLNPTLHLLEKLMMPYFVFHDHPAEEFHSWIIDFLDELTIGIQHGALALVVHLEGVEDSAFGFLGGGELHDSPWVDTRASYSRST